MPLAMALNLSIGVADSALGAASSLSLLSVWFLCSVMPSQFAVGQPLAGS